eukprot:9595225-Karenia_brevis.AAC.1
MVATQQENYEGQQVYETDCMEAYNADYESTNYEPMTSFMASPDTVSTMSKGTHKLMEAGITKINREFKAVQ